MELEDLSPVSVAEVAITKASSFTGDAAEALGGVVQQNEKSPNEEVKA